MFAPKKHVTPPPSELINVWSGKLTITKDQAYRRLNPSFAHWQNFSTAGPSFSFREIIPSGTRFGSGVRGRSFTRSPKA
jgi:hypothetical protein